MNITFGKAKDSVAGEAETPDDLPDPSLLDGKIYLVKKGTITATVNTYADLPTPASHTNEYYAVNQTTSNLVVFNRKPAGVYRCDGTTWVWINTLLAFQADPSYKKPGFYISNGVEWVPFSYVEGALTYQDITQSYQENGQYIVASQKALYDGLNSIANYEAVYVDPVVGNDSTGNGYRATPFKTIQAAINSFTAGSPHVIYVNGSTTGNITFRSGDQSMMIMLDAKTQHSGTITFVAGNTSIYFLSPSGKATISGTVNDACSGNVYFDAIVSGTYNKTGGSGSVAPTGYVEFCPSSNVDSLVLTISGNTTVRTLGTGAMGQFTQTNGLFAAQHKGTIYAPAISGGVNPLVGQPICLLQGQLQLLKNGSNKSLTCSASYGLVYLAGISTLQNDFSTYGQIDFTGSGANCFCYVWGNTQLKTSGDIFPPTGALLANLADYTSANRTATNYTASNSSVKGHLAGIDTAIGNKVDYTQTQSLTVVQKRYATSNIGAIPALTEAERALTSWIAGEIIWNKDTRRYQRYNGSTWSNWCMQPIGTMFYVSSLDDLDENVLFCDSSTLSKASYPELFAVTRTRFGRPSANNFSLPPPDCFLRGVGGSGTYDPDYSSRTAILSGTWTMTGLSRTSGSPNITVSSTDELAPGMSASATGIPANTVVRSILSSTVFVMGNKQDSANVNATSSGTSFTITFSKAPIGNYPGSFQDSQNKDHGHIITDSGHSHNTSDLGSGLVVVSTYGTGVNQSSIAAGYGGVSTTKKLLTTSDQTGISIANSGGGQANGANIGAYLVIVAK